MRDGFIIHEKTLEQLSLLTDEEAGQLLRAMAAHYKGEERPEVERVVEVVLITAEDRMDADASAYDEMAEKRINSAKKAAAARWSKDTEEDAENAVALNRICEEDAENAVSVSDSVSVSAKENKKRGGFRPPTLEEVKEYCEERGNQVDPETFLAYYESQNWKKSNGQKVVDWKGCVRTWEARDKAKPPREPPKKAYQTSDRQRTKEEWADLEARILNNGGRYA